MEDYMDVAIDLSDDNFEKKYGGPFGACIVKDGKIIARAHNQKEQKKDTICHAEILAIKKASKKLKKERNRLSMMFRAQLRKSTPPFPRLMFQNRFPTQR